MLDLSCDESSDKLIDFMLVLKINISKSPIENSRLAKPKIKKLLEINVISLLEVPVNIV